MEHSLSANHTMRPRVCAHVCVCGRTYPHYTLERVRFCCRGAVGRRQRHHQLNKTFAPKVTSSSLAFFFFLSRYNEAAVQSAMQTSLPNIYYNHSGALFSLRFMACSSCSSILVFFGLVKCCHSPVFGCGPEGP